MTNEIFLIFSKNINFSIKTNIEGRVNFLPSRIEFQSEKSVSF